MWQKLGPIAVGGTVFGIAVNQHDQTWLATGAGIFQRTETGWSSIPQSRPLTAISDLCGAGDKWWAAGLAGDLIRSWDDGHSWQYCWIDQVAEPITCFAVSPRYSTDYVLLAGTNGAGVLRSNDGGRRWLLTNFGLQDFTILTLALATDWSRREYVFAGTLSGIYRSSSGGRAWKAVGLNEMAVQALAASALFAENGLVIAGTETNGLYRSIDRGRSWQQVQGDFPDDFTVNALLNFTDRNTGQECWLAGSDDGNLWRSIDQGLHWTNVFSAASPVLVLTRDSKTLFAGLSEQGLLTSTDAGQSWQVNSTLYGYGFQRLRLGYNDRLFGIAPNDGVWVSVERGQSWDYALEASLGQPLFDFTLVNEGQVWLAAWADGLWRRFGDGDWDLVLPAEKEPIVALASSGKAHSPVWAAGLDCCLWQSEDEGVSWQSMQTPFNGQQLVALAASPEDSTLVLASLAVRRHELTLWRFHEQKSGWEEWFSHPVPKSPYIHLTVSGMRAGQARLIINNELWGSQSGKWQKMASFEGTIRQMALQPASQSMYLLVGHDVLTKAAGGDWTPLELCDEINELIDIQTFATGELLAMDVTGVVWQYSS